MTVDQQKLRDMITQPKTTFMAGALRREGNVFFIDGELPAKSSLEALFDSHCQSPAELFCIAFRNVSDFHCGEDLARLVKKNFSAHLLGRFRFPPSLPLMERAYAAGIDIIDIPLGVFDPDIARERALNREALLISLSNALTVFPRWSVVSTLDAGEEPPSSTRAGIDHLLAAGILPLVELAAPPAGRPASEIGNLFEQLAGSWRSRKATIKPLQPLIDVTTPLAPLKSKGVLKGLFDKVYEQKLLAASDLRRSLRVRQIEQSFESAGL